MNSILVVEDDAAVRSFLVFVLRRSGYEALEAGSGNKARQVVEELEPDLVLLDRMLPDVDGLEVLREWRRSARTAELPVIMLTACADEADRVDGLSSGADDYVTKPFSKDELLLRIHKLVRRNGIDSAENGVLQIEGLMINRSEVRVAINDQLVELSAIEFRVLDFLASNAERVHTRGEIIDKVWTRGDFVDPRTVDVHIHRLRRVLERTGHARLIQTVRGIGYRFSSEVA